jgi:predicted nucleic-acid-binding protein
MGCEAMNCRSNSTLSGDFADGAIAYEGKWLGADTFVSFDKKAVKLAEAYGGPAHLLS